jgi:hypothetical protein
METELSGLLDDELVDNLTDVLVFTFNNLLNEYNNIIKCTPLCFYDLIEKISKKHYDKNNKMGMMKNIYTFFNNKFFSFFDINSELIINKLCHKLRNNNFDIMVDNNYIIIMKMSFISIVL